MLYRSTLCSNSVLLQTVTFVYFQDLLDDDDDEEEDEVKIEVNMPITVLINGN